MRSFTGISIGLTEQELQEQVSQEPEQPEAHEEQELEGGIVSVLH